MASKRWPSQAPSANDADDSPTNELQDPEHAYAVISLSLLRMPRPMYIDLQSCTTKPCVSLFHGFLFPCPKTPTSEAVRLPPKDLGDALHHLALVSQLRECVGIHHIKGGLSMASRHALEPCSRQTTNSFNGCFPPSSCSGNIPHGADDLPVTDRHQGNDRSEMIIRSMCS